MDKRTSTNGKNTRKKNSELRRIITLWHKRIGIACAFFVILLSLTGVLLNHTGAFKLDQHFVSSPLLLNFYSVQAPTVRAFPLGDSWLSEADSQLYLGANKLISCEGKLVAALKREAYWLAVCSRSLILFTPDNQMVEKAVEAFGLPVPISRAGACSAFLCFERDGQLYQFDTDMMSSERISQNVAEIRNTITWQQSQNPPADMLRTIENKARSNVISMEKLVLDIHAGRYFGSLGPWIMDVLALLLVILSLTGIYMWWKKAKR